MKTRFDNFVYTRYLPHIEAVLKPRTVQEYKRILEKLILPQFGRKLLNTPNRHTIERWHRGLAKTTPYQANRALAVLSGVYTRAIASGFASSNPAPGIKYVREKMRENPLTPAQVQRFLLICGGSLPSEDGSFLMTLLYTGARPGELAEARWEYLNEDTLELPDSKVGARTIYLPPAALVAMAPVLDPAHGEETASGPIWPGVKPQALWKRMKRIDAGMDAPLLQKVRMYDLRHTFASAGLAANLSLEAISQLLGHRDPRTTRRYTHMSNESGCTFAGQITEKLQEAGNVR